MVLGCNDKWVLNPGINLVLCFLSHGWKFMVFQDNLSATATVTEQLYSCFGTSVRRNLQPRQKAKNLGVKAAGPAASKDPEQSLVSQPKMALGGDLIECQKYHDSSSLHHPPPHSCRERSHPWRILTWTRQNDFLLSGLAVVEHLTPRRNLEINERPGYWCCVTKNFIPIGCFEGQCVLGRHLSTETLDHR